METPSLVVEWAKFLCVTIIHRLLLNGGEVFLEGSILLFDVVESWAPIHKMLLIVLSLHHIISKIIGSVM